MSYSQWRHRTTISLIPVESDDGKYDDRTIGSQDRPYLSYFAQSPRDVDVGIGV